MAVEKRRLLYEFYILSTKNSPTRSEELVEEIGVSVRTFKSDIEDLKQFAIASGARLESKNGVGYWLEVIDHSIFDPVKEQLDISFNAINYTKASTYSRRNDILRMIIASNDYVKIEDIASSLYLSVSAIRKDLKDARNFLNSYHLSIDSKKDKGIKVTGNEFGKRMCMIELLEKHYFKAIYLYKDLSFSAYFECDEKTKDNIRQIVLKHLRNSHTPIIDKSINRLCKYYFLANNRAKEGSYLHLSKKTIAKLEHYPYRSLAKDIVSELNTLEGINLPEEEIDSTEILLIIAGDYDCSTDIKKDFSCIYHKIVELRNLTIRIVQDEFHIDLTQISNCNKVIESGLVAIAAKMDLGINSYLYLEKAMAGTSLLYSGVVSIMAEKVIKMIGEKYQTSFNSADVTVLAVRIYYLISSISFDYQPLSLAICSRNGNIGSEIIKNKILKRYNKEWFKRIDIHEYYEMRMYDKYDYDYILINFPVYSYRYDIPYMSVSQIITNEQILDLYNKIIVKNYMITDILEDFHFSKECIYADYEFDTPTSFIQMLAYKNVKDTGSIKGLIEKLQDSSSYHLADNVWFIMCDTQYTKGNCFELYQLKKKGVVEDRNINYIIFLSVDFGDDFQKFKYIEQVVYYLIRFSKNREEFIQANNIEYLNSIVYEGLING